MIFADQVPFPNPPNRTFTGFLQSPESDPFSGLMKTPPDENIVQRCGQILCAELTKNERIRQSLKQITDAPAARPPIYLKLLDARLGNLPWEALWLNSFLSLDINGHIARLGSKVADQAVPAERWIEPALRVMIVLAAAPRSEGAVRVDATGEWNRVWGQLKRLGTDIRVCVIVCQSELASEIESLRDSRIQCKRLIGNDPLMLARMVKSFAPNIVHFFCHGAPAGELRLDLANMADYDGNAAEGSVSLSSTALATIGQNDSVWLLVLNCCKGAHSGAGSKSLAGLIADSGVPAVVAMRDDVNYSDAQVFSGAYYGRLVELLTTYLPNDTTAASGGTTAIPETVWVDSMYPTRTELSKANGRVPESWPEWTLPVVYVQDAALSVRARPRTAESRVAAQAAVTSNTPYHLPTPIAAVGSPGGERQQPETRATQLVLRRNQLVSVRAELSALNGPKSLTSILDTEIARIERKLAFLERDTLLIAIDTLKGTPEISPEMLTQFFLELESLNERLGPQ